MKTKIGMSFGLALVLVMGVLATMLALGNFSDTKVHALSGPGGSGSTFSFTIPIENE